MTFGKVTGAILQATSTKGLVDSASLRVALQTRGLVDHASLSVAAATTKGLVDSATLRSAPAPGATKGLVTGAYLVSAVLEPYVGVKLPAGTWSRVSGPVVALPIFPMPGGTITGTGNTLVVQNTTGMQVTMTAIQHTSWGHGSGVWYPIRDKPSVP